MMKLKQFYSVPETAKVVGIGRDRMYELVKQNKIRTVVINNKTKISLKSIDELVSAIEERKSDENLPTVN
jgi:excisionase family DNA binding protein|tara:strand:+ start:43 stop:252 length:210 start_codon:yes stop_codon:yes gene_type:complete